MISDKVLAKESLDFHLGLLKQITDHLREVRGKMSEDEFKVYASKSGKITLEILGEFINEISVAYPELKPAGFNVIGTK